MEELHRGIVTALLLPALISGYKEMLMFPQPSGPIICTLPPHERGGLPTPEVSLLPIHLSLGADERPKLATVGYQTT